MREEITTTNFLPTKAEIQSNSKAFAKGGLLDAGETNPQELLSQAIRLKRSVNGN